VHWKPVNREIAALGSSEEMRPMNDERRLRWVGPVLAAAGAAAYVGLLVSAAGGFADHDVFVMARVARDVLDGKALYAEAWDNKAPLAILFYAVPVSIAPGSYPAIQLWLGLWLVAQAAIVWFGLGRASGASRWIAVGLLLLLPLQRAEWCWPSSEHAGNLFVVVALVVAWRVAIRRVVRLPDLAAAGAAVALAFNVRQNQVLLGIVPVLAVLVAFRGRWRDAVRPLAAFAAGVALAWALVLGVVLVASHGALGGYVRAVFLAPAAYGRSWGEAAWLVTLLRNDLTVFLAFAVALVSLTGAHRWLSAALTVTTVAVMLLPMRGHPHYWVQAFPAAALLGALAVDALGIVPGRVAALQGAIVAGLLTVSGLFTVSDLAASGERERLDAVGAEIRSALGPDSTGGTLFAAGRLSAYLYFSTSAPTAHPIFWQDWMFGSLRSVLPMPIEEVLRGYSEQPPSVIAIDEDTVQRVLHEPAPDEEADVPLLRTLLASGQYAEVGRDNGWRILRR
jgi:hypothetical protein